jgi:UDP-glucuronate 4-epimerase|tara:strand:- start:11400 stop:12350 length:951 start_codon:yes stop_codon:yes gene_type:complete
MKICITGGAGFIGFHLAQKLRKEGHGVFGFDNFNSYYDVDLKRKRAEILESLGIHIEPLDLRVRSKLIEYLDQIRPDVIMHLAAMAGVRHSMDDPTAYVDNNILGTHNLIEACDLVGIEKVVYASTSCVMAGNPLPWNEEEKLGVAKNPYGYSKATNEAQFISSKIDSTIGLRFFTVYGPWGRPDMALFDFTKSIIEEKPIKLFNNGDMVRDFTYVDDIVQGVGLVIDRINEKSDINEIYNIGYGQQVQLMEFVKHIEQNLDREAIKEYVPMHPADTHKTWSDTSKIRQLGYSPKTPIGRGVYEFVQWYKDYYHVN